LQRALDGCDTRWAGLDFTRRRQVVIGCALIAHGADRDDDVTHRDRAIEHAGAAAGDEFPAAQRDDLIQQACGQRRANTRMEYRQAAPLEHHFVDRMCADLALARRDARKTLLPLKLADDLLEETNYAMLRRADRFDEPLRLNDRFQGWVVFQDRIRLA